MSKVPAKDLKPFTTVSVVGVVVRQDPRNSQTLLWVPGIGQSGQWSLVSSAECEVVAEPTELVRRAFESALQQAREQDHPVVRGDDGAS